MNLNTRKLLTVLSEHASQKNRSSHTTAVFTKIGIEHVYYLLPLLGILR